MRKGAAGTHALNKRLQNLLNPPAADKPECTVGGTVCPLCLLTPTPTPDKEGDPV
jgi:ATP-dependent exoDNAse (exonuclease V) alpha subunit